MTEVRNILERHGMAANAVYLLELVPLIDMIWADGKNQEKEISILKDFTIRHLANLSHDADGLEVVSVKEASLFIDRFMRERPSPELMEELGELAIEKLKNQDNREKADQIVATCMDIAAACVTEYPYSPSDRVQQAEKDLIRELISKLGLD